MTCEDCFSEVCIEGHIHGPFLIFLFPQNGESCTAMQTFFIQVSPINGFEINPGMLRSFRQE